MNGELSVAGATTMATATASSTTAQQRRVQQLVGNVVVVSDNSNSSRNSSYSGSVGNTSYSHSSSDGNSGGNSGSYSGSHSGSHGDSNSGSRNSRSSSNGSRSNSNNGSSSGSGSDSRSSRGRSSGRSSASYRSCRSSSYSSHPLEHGVHPPAVGETIDRGRTPPPLRTPYSFTDRRAESGAEAPGNRPSTGVLRAESANAWDAHWDDDDDNDNDDDDDHIGDDDNEPDDDATAATATASHPSMRHGLQEVDTGGGVVWDDRWDQGGDEEKEVDGGGGGSVRRRGGSIFENATGESEGEEKQEIEFAATVTSVSPPPLLPPSPPPVLPPTSRDTSLEPCPPLPLLSVGPYLGSGGGLSSSSNRHDRRQGSRTPNALPNSSMTRAHSRKMSAARLGILQSAQNLASATSGGGGGGSGGVGHSGGGGDAAVAAASAAAAVVIGEGSGSAQSRRPLGPTVVGGGGAAVERGGGREEANDAAAANSAVDVAANAAAAAPPLDAAPQMVSVVSSAGSITPLVEADRRPANSGAEESGVGGGGSFGCGRGRGGVGGVAGEARRLRARANSFIGRLPGPKQILQALEEEMDVRNIRLTAQSEPIILMEVMPAAMVASLLVMTYLVFGMGLSLITRYTLEGTSTLPAPMGDGGVDDCSNSSSIDYSGGASASGCTLFDPTTLPSSLSPWWLLSPSPTSSAETPYGAVFTGNFAGITDLFGSVSLHASFASNAILASLPDPAIVDLNLEACVGGAGDGGEWGDCEEGWEPVLFQEGISARVRNLPADRGYTMFNFYQHQETIQGQPLISQYRVQVGFLATAFGSSMLEGSGGNGETQDFAGLSSAQWALEYETGATELWARITVACVLALWLPAWLYWCHVVFRRNDAGGFKNALDERKWLAFLGLAVTLYLNPVMIVGNFVAPESASWGLASEMSLSVAIAVFLVVALCIADGIGRSRARGTSGTFMVFYIPKIAFGVTTLLFMLLVDLTSYPSVLGWERGSLLAVQNWPDSQREAFSWVGHNLFFRLPTRRSNMLLLLVLVSKFRRARGGRRGLLEMVKTRRRRCVIRCRDSFRQSASAL